MAEETPRPGSTQTPAQPSALAQELGIDGLLERFFAVTLDTRKPRYSDVSVPGLLESPARRSVVEAESARATIADANGLPDAITRRENSARAEARSVRTITETETARTIITRARVDYADMVNNKRMDRKTAAMAVIAHLEDAEGANNNVMTRLLDNTYRELTVAARAEREGTMPYRSPRPFTPYVIPPAAPAGNVRSPGRTRADAVSAAQAEITADLNAMNATVRRNRTGSFSMSGMVSPGVVNDFLTTLSRDMQDGYLNNNSPSQVNYGGINFVPLDRRSNPVSDEEAASIARVEKALKKPGGAVVDEALAADIARVSELLTSKASGVAAMQGPLPAAPLSTGEPVVTTRRRR